MLSIVDTTLRDGEQTPGLALTTDEKVSIAKLLSQIGIREIEAGTPIMGGDEAEAIKEIVRLDLPARIFTWNRAVEKDVAASLTCGVRDFHISCPVSDIQIEKKLGSTREKIKNHFVHFVSEIKREGYYVACGLEDASRADPHFVLEISKLLELVGVDRIRVCDTVGILTPSKTFTLIQFLKNNVSIPIEIHTHNDFGLATANALAGIEAGASFVDTTILGIGERAGNAPLEEVILALKQLLNMEIDIDIAKLPKLAAYLGQILNYDIPPWKAIVGENVFAHESGIHVDGILKDPKNYEPFPPEYIGLKRKIVIGKHSGTRALKEAFKKLGITLDEKDTIRLLQQVRKLAIHKKNSVSESELLNLYYNFHQHQSEMKYKANHVCFNMQNVLLRRVLERNSQLMES